MKFDQIRENMESWWDNLAEGWRQLWKSSANALTRFKVGEQTNMPEAHEVDDVGLPRPNWSILGGDLFEDDSRLVVRLEIPGLDKDDLHLEVLEDSLVVSGEKRFERETTDGQWRVMQRAYGAFRRVVPLPARVQGDAASASYRNGVLRVELPKLPEQPHSGGHRVNID